jgi:hypothetical protein
MKVTAHTRAYWFQIHLLSALIQHANGGCAFTVSRSTITILLYRETNVGQITFETHFNFAPGDLATLLLGMLGDAPIQSSHGKSGQHAFTIR